MFLAKIGITFICIGLLITNFSTDVLNMREMWRLLVDEEKENVKHVLQGGAARCFISNISKTISVVCHSNIIRSFSLGDNFNFDNCSFP